VKHFFQPEFAPWQYWPFVWAGSPTGWQDREDRPGRFALGRHHYCTAAIGLMRLVGGGKNDNYINHLDGYDTILTCLDAVSMVRAALEGDGRHFPSTQASFRV